MFNSVQVLFSCRGEDHSVDMFIDRRIKLFVCVERGGSSCLFVYREEDQGVCL